MSVRPRIDERDLLDDIYERIPDDFFNHEHVDERNCKTVALFDFIYAIKEGNPAFPELSHYETRKAALKDLKDSYPTSTLSAAVVSMGNEE